jgi:predicted nucleic acid-binding protein
MPRRNIHICRDPKDDMLIACCLASKAVILLTGDKDLLSISDAPPGLEILRPKEFLLRT